MLQPRKKTGDQLNREAYQKSLLQAKKELAEEYVQKNMKDVNDSFLWNLPGNIYAGIPKYGINLGKGSFNAIKHQAKMISLAQTDNLITEGADVIEKQYDEKSQKKYAMGGNLTQFNEGGTHEQNPLGGIPQGQGANGQINTVEQGETKQGNFVYSDRIILTPKAIDQFGIPKSLAGKTVANATKIIDAKFKDRNDKISISTKNSMLSKLNQAQETIKAEQDQLAQAQQTNSTMAPEDMMNGQIPQGMEEYGEQPGQPDEPEQMAYGGYQNKMFLGGDESSQGLNALGDSFGGYAGVATTGLQIGSELFGKSKIDTSGASDTVDTMQSGAQQALSGAVSGAKAGSMFGPIGSGVGAAIGGISGLVGANKDRKALEQAAINRNLRQYNTKFSDFANGGNMYYDENNPYFTTNPGQVVPFGQETVSSNKFVRPAYEDTSNEEFQTPSQSMLPTATKAGFEKYYDENKPIENSKYGLNKEMLTRGINDLGRLAPVIGNAFQKISKPEVVNPILNTRKFNPEYVDEKQLQNSIAGQDTYNAIQNANMSQGATTNAILGAGLNKNKAMSDAYIQANNQNRSMNLQGQSFDNSIDEANIARKINAEELTARNKGAYDSARSEKLNAITKGIGDVSKENMQRQIMNKVTGYNTYGEYIKNPETGAWMTKDGKPASIGDVFSAIMKGESKQNALGGYMINKRKK